MCPRGAGVCIKRRMIRLQLLLTNVIFTPPLLPPREGGAAALHEVEMLGPADLVERAEEIASRA